MGSGRKLRFGLFEANVESGELFRKGQKVRIQEQPFQVLVALLERPGEVVTRDELRQRLWASDTFVEFEHSLNTTINKVRDALGDSAQNPRYVETLPKRGYRFIAPVEDVGAAISEQRVATPVAETSAPEVLPTGVAGGQASRAKEELPRASRTVSRVLFGTLQVMYLVFYGLALWRLEEVVQRGAVEFGIPSGMMLGLVLVTGAVGVALRLYTLNATLFDYGKTAANFQKMFVFVLVLDLIWALSPLMIMHVIGLGLAFAACAALVYSPFAQRVLAWMAWGQSSS